MTIPSTIMPDSPRPSEFRVTRMSSVLRSVPITGAHRAQTRVMGEDHHSVALTYNPMSKDQFGELIPFLNSRRGTHDQFGVVIPNYDPSSVVSPGNYITLSNGKCVQIESVGSLASPSQLFIGSTNPSATQTFSNGIAATAGVPLAVYFEASSVVSTATVELYTSATGTTGANASNVVAVNSGRNVVCLTPSQSGLLYVKVAHGTTASIGSWSIYEGLQVSVQTATTAPRVQVSDDTAYYLPAPAAIMPVSMSANKFDVTYDKNTHIKIKVDLMERRI